MSESKREQKSVMAECAQRTEGCFGERMTGAGFGGCVVALVRSDVAERFGNAVAGSYHKATGLTPKVYVCQPTNGAEIV